jgi:hypothetical protein
MSIAPFDVEVGFGEVEQQAGGLAGRLEVIED